MKNQEQGFSLVELMIVITIIGVLVAIAVPKFNTFQARARQAEAKNNLSHIYTLQQAYYADNDEYAELPSHGNGSPCTKNDLGFLLQPCDKSRYTYKAQATSDGFTAEANSGENAKNKIVPNCADADKWTINQKKELDHVQDAIKECGND